MPKERKKFLSDESEDQEGSQLHSRPGQDFRAVTRQVLTDDAAIQCNLDVDAETRSRAHYYANEEYHNHGLHTLAELCLRDIEPYARSSVPTPPPFVPSSILQRNPSPLIFRRNSVETAIRHPDILEPEDASESSLSPFRSDIRTSSEERPSDDPSRTFEFERVKSEVSSAATSDIEEETDVISDEEDDEMRIDIEGDDKNKDAISAKVELELEKMLQGKQEIIAREVKEFLENNSVVMKEVAKDTGLTETDINRFLLEGWHLKEDKKRKFYKWYLGKKYSSPRKDENFTCYKCGKIFAYESYLQRHVKYVCPDKTGRTWKCSFCSKAFQYPCYLRRHMRSHTGESPYKCSQCSRAFVRSTDLQRHLRNHTGEKPYKCAECSRAFARSTDLKRHMRTHTGEKPYKCAECSKAFSQSGSLQTHLHTHYKDQINNKGSFLGKSLKS